MSVASIPIEWEEPVAEASPQEQGWNRRAAMFWVPLMAPLALTGVSWLAGGLPLLTDLGFLILTGVCVVFLLRELLVFPQRFGVGALVLYGGALIWFCYDYCNHWLLVDFKHLPFEGMYQQTWGQRPYTPAVLAKSSFFHCLFLVFASLGLLISKGRWAVRTLAAIPEPANRWFYLLMLLAFCAIGLFPYAFFAVDPFHVAVMKHIRGGYGLGIAWTVGRGGTINTTSLAATFLVQMLELGYIAGAFASFYAILIARSPGTKLLGWAVWLFWLLMAIGTGARTNSIIVALPAVALLFLKHNVTAALLLRRISPRAYLTALVLGLLLLAVVQYQGLFRTTRFEERNLDKLSLTNLMGNTMFSEGLLGYYLIPETKPFLYDTFPGAAVVRPIPQTVFDFVAGFIPRPLWKNKPVGEVAIWYSRAVTGDTNTLEQGITGVSRGIVGHWYFPYGWVGVVQGGLLFGWLMAVGERALRDNLHRPLTILLVLGFLNFMFRAFRDLTFVFAYPLVFSGILLFLLVKAERTFVGGGEADEAPARAAGAEAGAAE